MERQVWWNGNFVPESNAKVSIYDSAMMFGDIIFTMMRTFNGKVFQLDRHMDRLFNNLKYMYLDIPYTKNQIKDAVYQTIEVNKPTMQDDDEHRILIDITRGLLSIYQDVVGVEKGINVIIADFPLRWTTKGMSKYYQEGINAIIPSQRTIPANLLEPKVKNRNRIHYLMANIEISQHKGNNNWALLLDNDGYITEGTGANFFIVTKENEVVTPEPRNVLRGISRNYVMEICRKHDIKCYERNIELYDVVTAQEAFFTGTPFCLLPVVSINGLQIGEGIPLKKDGITNKILTFWNSYVGLNIKNQIESWDNELNTIGNFVSPYTFNKDN